MAKPDAINVLNRLFEILHRSLPTYLTDACPWTHPGDEKASEALGHIVADQRSMAGRVAELIDARGGRVAMGSFPMQFTDTNLLSLDYLLRELVRCQRADVAAIEKCVRDVSGDREARALAEEVLGAERAHLEVLEELVKQPA
ncbi:MAG: hypothetical protein HYX69_15290 [Planctomycetia bacterium]|nr:hypothetical protein [Planctomycetia bacterium]